LFHIYMDNYFTNVPLFSDLRKLGIGAAGTTRQNSKGYPVDLSEARRGKEELEWNTLKAKVVGEEGLRVLALLWMDSNYVNFLTTIHNVNGNENYVVCKRRCRSGTTKADKNVQKLYKPGEKEKLFPVPRAIWDYNHFMGGVDIHDQKRAHLSSHLRTRRNWLCLFFWLLDVLIINAHILYLVAQKEAGTPSKQLMSHREFRMRLVEELLNTYSTKRIQVSVAVEQLAGSSTRGNTKDVHELDKPLPPGPHESGFLPTRGGSKSQKKKGTCAYCRANSNLKRSALQEASPNNSLRPSQTSNYCNDCKVFLCQDKCWKDYHARRAMVASR
jgi:hypothetical protein